MHLTPKSIIFEEKFLLRMLKYNTQQRRLILPEYGRNIQQMVEHCLTIEDRDERNACAR